MTYIFCFLNSHQLIIFFFLHLIAGLCNLVFKISYRLFDVYVHRIRIFLTIFRKYQIYIQEINPRVYDMIENIPNKEAKFVSISLNHSNIF